MKCTYSGNSVFVQNYIMIIHNIVIRDLNTWWVWCMKYFVLSWVEPTSHPNAIWYPKSWITPNLFNGVLLNLQNTLSPGKYYAMRAWETVLFDKNRRKRKRSKQTFQADSDRDGPQYKSILLHFTLAEALRDKLSDFTLKKITNMLNNQCWFPSSASSTAMDKVRLQNFPPASTDEAKENVMKSPNKFCGQDPVHTWLL